MTDDEYILLNYQKLPARKQQLRQQIEHWLEGAAPTSDGSHWIRRGEKLAALMDLSLKRAGYVLDKSTYEWTAP